MGKTDVGPPRTAELFVGPQRFSRGGRPGVPSGDPGYPLVYYCNIDPGSHRGWKTSFH